MTKSLVFSVAGTPRPQPRPRFVKGRVVSTADPKAKLWRLAVERAVKVALDQRTLPAFDGPVRLSAIFMFEPPPGCLPRVGTAHANKPDADNLAKLLQDVMESNGVLKNDSQIVDAQISKRWDVRAGVAVMVEDISEERRAPTSPAGEPPAWLTGPTAS